MRSIPLLLFALLLLGCVNPMTDESLPDESPSQNPSMVDANLSTSPPTAPKTEETLQIVKKGSSIHILSSSTDEDLVYSTEKVCENGVCLLSLKYTSAGKLETIHAESIDYNILNRNTFSLVYSPVFTIAITEEPVLTNCIFSYAQNDHTYVSNYFATFKRVCLYLDEMENETGMEAHPNYALVWNSQNATAGEYVGSDIIFLSQENPNQLSNTIIHEMVHSLMENARFPNWINEGLAEYYADKTFDTFHPKSKYATGVETWAFGNDDTNYNVSAAYYESAHTIIQNFAEKYGEVTLRILTHYFINHPLTHSNDSESIIEENEIILSKMRELSGDENIVSVEYLAKLHQKG